jgi:hypothetical protein
MQFERGKRPETPNAPYRAARKKDERWRSAGPGFEPGRAGPRLSLTSSQDEGNRTFLGKRVRVMLFAVCYSGSCPTFCLSACKTQSELFVLLLCAAACQGVAAAGAAWSGHLLLMRNMLWLVLLCLPVSYTCFLRFLLCFL